MKENQTIVKYEHLPEGFENWVKEQDVEFAMFCIPQQGLAIFVPGIKPFYAHMMFEEYIHETEDGRVFFNIRKYLAEEMIQKPEDE